MPKNSKAFLARRAAREAEVREANERDAAEVVALAERLGYGFVMRAAADAWAAKDPVGAHTVGPANVFTEPCGEVAHGDCCYGSGWVIKPQTKVIRDAKKRRGSEA